MARYYPSGKTTKQTKKLLDEINTDSIGNTVTEKWPLMIAYRKMFDLPVWDAQDPQSMQMWAKNDPFFLGKIANSKYNRMAYEENERWWDELSKYYGFDKDNMAFPFRAGRYGSFGNTSSGTPLFEAGNSVMSLYSNWYKKR